MDKPMLGNTDIPFIPLDQGPVLLTQPFPEEVASAPYKQVAEHVGQAALEKSAVKKAIVAPSKTGSDAEQKKDTKKDSGNKSTGPETSESEAKDGGQKVDGFRVADLKKSPPQAPEKSKSELKKETSNKTVKKLVFIGLACTIFGIVLFLTANAPLGVTVILSGCAVIIACVFLPIGAKKHK